MIDITWCTQLGEAVMSGLVNSDTYKLRNGEVIARVIGRKHVAVRSLPHGGTQHQVIESDLQRRPALTESQLVRLAHLGRRIEAHFGQPQEVEWCVADEVFHFVQSRPITTLFPIPTVGDGQNHVYVSVGHQQMMTDAMKPLGASFFRMTSGRVMHEAGGRLFVDVAADLASPTRRNVLVNVLGKSDPLIRDALMTLLERGDFIGKGAADAPQSPAAPNYQAQLAADPELVARLIDEGRASLAALKERIRLVSGAALFDFIQDDLKELRKQLASPQSFAAIMTGMNASAWLNEKMGEWLGEKNAADVLSQSAPNNITAEMGLALLDVADVVRLHSAVVQFLAEVKDARFLDALEGLPGGPATRRAILAFLERYGMRCVGEIDLTRARWFDEPSALVPLILANVRRFESGESDRKVARGRREAEQKEEELLARLTTLPDGDQKARDTKSKIELVRTFIGYREYPKYFIVGRYSVYREALLAEALGLVHKGLLRKKEDCFFLTFDELHEAVRSGRDFLSKIAERKLDHRHFERLRPPRVMTSDGEIIRGDYRRENAPANALVGLAVSSGVIEGRARVVLNLSQTDLEDDDILVTTFTDPSWTPLFLSIKGLVTEVGGLMTHGSVIAREYGMPAVVGVENATTRLKDGQRIRVNGTDGFVEILS